MNIDEIAELTPGIVTGFALFVVILEWIVLFAEHKVSNHKERVLSMISAGMSFLPIFVLNKVVLVALMFWLFQFKIFNLGFQWYVWLFAWLVYDFMFWFIHWISHNVRLLWCLHSVHHTPKEMKLSVAFRGSFLDFTLVPHMIVWLPLIGLHPFILLIVETIGRFYGILVHVNENWIPNEKRSWVGKIFISPSIHRVHHSTNHIYIDRNYGEAFTIWDLLFKTYQPELKEEKPVHGIMKDVDSGNLQDTQLHEFKSLWEDLNSDCSFFDKLKYALMPPGWNHIDGGKLGADIRKEALGR